MSVPVFNPVSLLWAARRDWVNAMERLAATGEPLLRAGHAIPVVVVQDPDAARQVLVADASSYGRPWIVRNIMGDALGRTTFLTDGQEWLARRQRVSPVFGRNHIDGLARVIASAIRSEIDTWSAGAATDMQANLTDLTMSVACRALLGAGPDDDLAREAREHFAVILAWVAHRFTHPLAPQAVVPTRRNRRMRAARADLEAAVREMIRRRRAGPLQHLDVLSLLLQHQESGEGPSDEEVVAECIGFLFAGHETTASTLTWALYELATHADAQETVAREGDDLDIERSDLFSATEGLAHTGRVVDEILRMYPAGIGIARVTTARTELAGYRLRRGTIVLVSVYGMQRGPAWDRPNEFDLGREFPPQPAQPGTAGYLPFGWGPRRCLGARFAVTEARLALALICSRWRLAYEQPRPPKAAVLPAVRIDGQLPLRLEDRDRAITTALLGPENAP
jgi:cytochrome P450